MNLQVLGLNYKTAPIEIREKFSVNKNSIRQGLENLADYDGLNEVVILSTCNRTEIYSVCAENCEESAKNFFNDLIGGDAEIFLYKKTGENCIRHLFEVAASLDSQIIGEGQILSQVKEAYAIAKNSDATGTILNTLFHKAITVGKIVRTETKIAYNSVSISSAAVDLAEKKLNGLENKKVLIFGAGKMAHLTAQHLISHGIKKIFVANRHLERAEEMAKKIGGEAVSWEDALFFAKNVDIIITSTGAPHYVIKFWQTQQLMTRREGKKIIFIDIAVPRDVEPEISKINGVTLYNIDDLENVVENNFQARREEAKIAEKIIDEFVEATVERFKYLKFQPLMADLSKRAEKIREREVKRVSGKFSNFDDDDKKIIDNMTKMIVRKLLRLPMMKLNASAGTCEEKFYTDAVRALFGE